MASFLLTATVGAVLNAAAFTGGSYLARFLSGSDQDAERKRHDLAIEKYEKDYNAWKKSMARAEQWKEEREERKEQAAHKFKSTDEAFEYYAQTHPDEELSEPQFSNYYKPSKEQKSGEMLFTGVTVAGLAYGISKIL